MSNDVSTAFHDVFLDPPELGALVEVSASPARHTRYTTVEVDSHWSVMLVDDHGLMDSIMDDNHYHD